MIKAKIIFRFFLIDIFYFLWYIPFIAELSYHHLVNMENLRYYRYRKYLINYNLVSWSFSNIPASHSYLNFFWFILKEENLKKSECNRFLQNCIVIQQIIYNNHVTHSFWISKHNSFKSTKSTCSPLHIISNNFSR